MSSTDPASIAGRAGAMTRSSLTPMQKGEKLVESLTRLTGVKWTFGYIGNVYPDLDDRLWYAFREHPGRVGTREDRIGGVSTEELSTLVTMLRGAVELQSVEKRARRLSGAGLEH